MSWRSRESGTSAWRQSLARLRQEAAAKGYVARPALQAAFESLRAEAIEVQHDELAEDLPFLVQQLVGPQPPLAASSSGGMVRDSTPHVALCRLLTGLTGSRTVSLHGSAANLVLSSLRQWSDGAQDGASVPTPRRPQNSTLATTSAASTSTPSSIGAGSRSCGNGTAATTVDSPSPAAAPASPSTLASSLPVEAMTALAALLPDHLGLLSEHERAAQLAALLSLLVPQSPQPQGGDGARDRGATELLELQVLALTTLAACCSRNSGASSSGSSGLTVDEAAALLSGAVSLLQSCVMRSRPVEDAAHSRLYASLVRALQAAIAESRQAWVPRAAMLVECLQRFLTYGVQASLAAAAGASSSSPAPADSGGAGGRYRPPHLRRRESQADGGSAWSDSDMSDTEHSGAAAGGASGAGAGGTVVDRFRSSRVRLAVLSCIQAMAKSDPRAMHAHWSALLPLQSPLQPRPLTPHLITVLLYDPLIKVRALAAATLSSLLDGPAQRSILAVAEAKSMTARAPVRGFLTLSLSLGQLLLAAHAGLLQSVAVEASPLVLPGVLRALVVLMAASPYERLPQELLPETLMVLRTRWAALTAAAPAAQSTAVAGELGPIQAAYLACLAECFSTKHPIAGLATFLLQHKQQDKCSNPSSPAPSAPGAAAAAAACGGGAIGLGAADGGGSSQALVRDLLALGRDASVSAVLRIEALAALKGLAAHYTAALPPDVWEDLRVAAAVGLSRGSPRSPAGTRSAPPSRSSSSSSIGTLPNHGSVGRLGDLTGTRAAGIHAAGPWGSPGGGGAGGTTAQAVAVGQVTSSANSSPEDKAAQLSVKLLLEYLLATGRQYGISRTDLSGGPAGDGDGGLPGPPPSPGFVPLAAAVPRHQQQQAGLSPMSVCSDEEREAGVQGLAARWRDAVAVMVPAATSHASYMVRSAGLACLGEVPEPVFSSLEPRTQQQLLTLLSDAAAADTVPAVRAAACKALGAVAAFPAVLAQPLLSDQVTCALLPCLRDMVLSVRIAAAWAVANLCDYYRRSLEAAESQHAEELRTLRAESHAHASTSTTRDASSPTQRSRSPAAAAKQAQAATEAALQLEPHHYRQLAALCGAAIIATQDTDKVRANGVRAVGNLLALLTPGMAPGLATAGGGRGTGDAAAAADAAAATDAASLSWRSGRRDGSEIACGGRGAGQRGGSGTANIGHGRGVRDSSISLSPNGNCITDNTARGNANTSVFVRGGGGGGGGGDGVQLELWLGSALTCLQSTLTTGGMKVQWNACCAAHGLLRNQRLLAHPRVASRLAPLLLLLVMLVRESANFKIRMHAAAALAALPSWDAYGDVLPDALLVVAGALDSISSGRGGGAAAAVNPVAGAARPQPAATAADQGDVEADGDGGEGRFPNYRYTVGLSAQLRATLLHLLALAQPGDVRRVREAFARRVDFLHACLKEQLAEAAQPLLAAAAAERRHGNGGTGSSGGPQIEVNRWGTSDPAGPGLGSAGTIGSVVEVDLPADPFGLWGGRGSSSPGGAAVAGGLAGLLAGLRLCAEQAQSVGTDASLSAEAGSAASSGKKSGLTVLVGCKEDELLQRARSRVTALAAPLRGFADLLTQLGPSVDVVLRDVREALKQLPSL